MGRSASHDKKREIRNNSTLPSSPFSKVVGFTCFDLDSLTVCSPHPEELALLSPRTVVRRKHEFVLGREAAHRSLQQVGYPSRTPILKGSHREPIWPLGYCGTITHSGDLVAAAVASTNTSLALGLDIELVERNFSQEIVRTIASPAEQRWITQNLETLHRRALTIFSAKESIYKAIFPICKRYLDFSVAELTQIAEGRFVATLSSELIKAYPELADLGTLSVDKREFVYKDRCYVLTAVFVPRMGSR